MNAVPVSLLIIILESCLYSAMISRQQETYIIMGKSLTKHVVESPEHVYDAKEIYRFFET